MSEAKDRLLEFLKDPSKRIHAAQLLRNDFKAYLGIMFLYINGTRFIFKPFHDKLIAKLQAIADGQNKKRNLLINIPVGAGKSIIVEYFITWCFARSIDHNFCYVSNSDKLINRLSKEAKDIVESAAWKMLFEHYLKRDDRARLNWSFDGSNSRAGLVAGTMGGSLTGLDAGNPNKEGFPGALIIDDPIDADDVKHVSYRDATIYSYDNKLAPRRRSPRTPTILIMQRLHLFDLAGWALATEPGDWDLCVVPALAKGKSFWPEKYSSDELLKISRSNAYKFAAQFQQKPIVAGGSVIKSEWFRFYPSADNIRFRKIFITADTAQKIKEHNDFSVFACWGVADNGLYLLDLIRGKWEAPELRDKAAAFWKKWQHGLNGTLCTAFYIEDKSSGTGLIQDIQRASHIPVIAIPREKDKLTRAEDNISYIESGNVLLPVDAQYAFNPAFISECEGFSRDMTHDHDDQCDVLFDAIEKGIAGRKPSILDVL